MIYVQKSARNADLAGTKLRAESSTSALERLGHDRPLDNIKRHALLPQEALGAKLTQGCAQLIKHVAELGANLSHQSKWLQQMGLTIQKGGGGANGTVAGRNVTESIRRPRG